MISKRTIDENGNKGHFWCVVHGHPDTGGARDAPPGTPIKCYSYNPNDPASEAEAKRKAAAMHAAIRIRQKEGKSTNQF